MTPAARAEDVGEPLDPTRLRRALGGFPTGVTVVTASIGGRIVGMTANSFSSVSLDPPLVSWCVANAASSHAAFVEADAYAVHVLGADHQDVALRFAGKSRDKFADIAHRPGRLGAPLIDGLAPVFECRVWARYPGGDHTILVGEVVHLVERVQEPLLFHSGVMRRIEQVRQRPDNAGATSPLADDIARASHAVSAELSAILVEFGLSVQAYEEALLRPLNDAERATLRHVLDLLIGSRRRDES